MTVVDFKKTKSGSVLANEVGGVRVQWGNAEEQFLTPKDLRECIGASLMGRKRYRFYTGGREVHITNEGKK